MTNTDNNKKILCFILFTSCLFGCVWGSPKKYEKYSEEDSGFQPSNMRYYETTLPNESNKSRKHDYKDSDRLERFGYISSFGNTGGGNGNTPSYGTTATGTMVPLKIDIGGIALGALIGLGAILIIPKLTQVFSTNYGYRSLEDEGTLGGLTEILNKVDNTLEQQNIDSTSCMQRIICSYVHEAQDNMKNREASTVDQIIYSLANNSLFGYMLDGSSIKQAFDMGKVSDVEKCSNLYTKCPVSKDNILEIIRKLLPA